MSHPSNKRFKITEEEEISLDSQKSSKRSVIDSEEIKNRIDRLQKSNPGLKENFGKLENNMRKLSSQSRNETNEISKKQDVPLVAEKLQKNDVEMDENSFARLPTSESLGGVAQPANVQEQALHESLAQYLFLSLATRDTSQNSFPSTLSPELEMYFKTKIIQDLFLTAFKRYLQSTKDNIRDNLSSLLSTPAMPRSSGAPNPSRRASGDKRKKSDLLSNDTIESDKNRKMSSALAPSNLAPRNRNLSLSSFKRLNLGSSPMQLPAQKPEDSEDWDPREEKKQ